MTQTLDRRTFIGAVAAGMIAAPLAAGAQAASLAIISAPATVNAGDVFQATFRVTAGSAVLRSAGPNRVGIGSQNPRDNRTWSLQRVVLPADVPANTSLDVIGTFTAPATPGTYEFAWQLVEELIAWIGRVVVSQSIVVSETGTPPPPGDEPFATGSVGTPNVAQGDWSLAGGSGSETGLGAGGAFAWGQGAQAMGGGSIAFGRGAKSMYTDTFVVGQGCRADSDNGRAAGWACHSYGDQGFAHGHQASDRGIDGLEAYAHGSFDVNPETLGSATAQTCRVVVRAKTNNATPTALTTDGGPFGFNNQMRLPDDASYVLQWLVIARDSANGDSRAWRVLAMATRGAGAGTTTVFPPTVTDISTSLGATGWRLSLTADTYNGAVQLNGIGAAGRPIQWVAAMIDSENVG
jgi:hypothetical protein